MRSRIITVGNLCFYAKNGEIRRKKNIKSTSDNLQKKKTSFEFVPIVDFSYILNSEFSPFFF